MNDQQNGFDRLANLVGKSLSRGRSLKSTDKNAVARNHDVRVKSQYVHTVPDLDKIAIMQKSRKEGMATLPRGGRYHPLQILPIQEIQW